MAFSARLFFADANTEHFAKILHLHRRITTRKIDLIDLKLLVVALSIPKMNVSCLAILRSQTSKSQAL